VAKVQCDIFFDISVPLVGLAMVMFISWQRFARIARRLVVTSKAMASLATGDTWLPSMI
jgi:hypothetical protein